MMKRENAASFYRRITGNALYLLIGIGLANIARFGANVILARQFGTGEYAAIAFILGIVNMSAFLADLGLFTAMTKRVAEERGNNGLGGTIRNFWQATWCAGLVGAIICSMIVSASSASPLANIQLDGIWLCGGWVFASVIIRSFIALYNGFEAMHCALANYFLEEPLKLLMILFLFMTGHLTLQAVIWGWSLIAWVSVALASGLGHLFLARQHVRLPSNFCSWSESFVRVREGLNYYLPFIGRIMLPPLVTVILGLFAAPVDTAWFAASASLASIVLLVLGPVSLALLPAFTQRYAHTGQAISPAEGAQLLRILGFFNVCVFLGFVIFGSHLLRWTYGDSYVPAVGVLMILAAANFFESFRLGLDPLLNSINAALTVSLIEVVRLILLVPLVVGFGWRYGAIGAAGVVVVVAALTHGLRLRIVCERFTIAAPRLLSLRYLIWLGGVLLGWHTHVPGILLILLSGLFGWGLQLYQPHDVRRLFRLLPFPFKIH